MIKVCTGARIEKSSHSSLESFLNLIFLDGGKTAQMCYFVIALLFDVRSPSTIYIPEKVSMSTTFCVWGSDIVFH